MLLSISISNIVLIEKLNLEFGPGLNILTGETGAGKSILMDSLSLALGARSDTSLVRHGCENACVVAEFDIVPNEVRNILQENGVDIECGLILRRNLSTDGKSRAWINDTPVSIKLLKQVGDALVEIHGQFANYAMLNPSTHRSTLDLFGCNNVAEYKALMNKVREDYLRFSTVNRQLQELQEMLQRNASERDFLEHNVAELRTLNIKPGEEEELAARRANMINLEKNAAILREAQEALSPHGISIESQLFAVAHILQRIRGDENPYTQQIDMLYNAAETVAEISASLVSDSADVDDIDRIEERLFAIRAVARKHRVTADEIPALLEKMETQLNAIDNSDALLQQLSNDVKTCRRAYDNSANALHDARMSVAEMLRTRLLAELPDLKLAGADFMVQISPTDASANGTDDIIFMIKTNPGSPFAPLHKSASGGELARLMLAMRVVLAGADDVHTFVFDEIDTGISGATASAVGARLNRLAQDSQALVITHSAQVAGYADRHYKISKSVQDNKTTTCVHEISADERINEIARIISGAEITPESITMAQTLIKNN